MAKQDNIFRVRLNCVDHYQNPPTSLDPPLWGQSTSSSTQRNNLPKVPVIRIFGATETGQKVCAHVHGAFPYLFIPYTESLDNDEVEHYIYTLRLSIDHALASSYRRNPYADARTSQFVANISLVKGVPFFGYTVGYKYFLKICLLNPQHMTRFADLLQQGAILARVFQPYEAHAQYLLQWMCDFNLYGCAYVETDKPYFRPPIPSRDELDEISHLWHDHSIDPGQILAEDRFPRQSHCQLELDIRVEDILNRHSVQARELHHSFIERLASMENLPPEEKLVHSMAGLWKDETRRRKLRMGLTDPSSSPFPPEVLVSMSADPRNDSKGGWIHEDEFREMVNRLAEQERNARGGNDLTYESFLSQKDHDDDIQTILESVGELFHDNLMAKYRVNHAPNDHADVEDFEAEYYRTKMEHDLPNATQPLVDMDKIEQVVADDDYGSDEETARIKALTQKQKLEDAGINGAMGEGKVQGTAAEIEHEAGQVQEATVPMAVVGDLEQRSLKRGTPVSTQGPFKRVKFDVEPQSPSPKRTSFRVRDIKPERRTKTAYSGSPNSFEPPPNVQKPRQSEQVFNTVPSRQSPHSSQRSSQSQSSQGNTISFPVVKNATDSETALRLSQRDDLSHLPHRSSQASQKEEPARSSDSSHEQLSSQAESGQSTFMKSPQRPRINPLMAANYSTAFNLPSTSNVFVFGALPPSFDEVEATVEPSVIYQDAYYSNEKDVPERVREYAGQEFRLESNTLPFLQAFDKYGQQLLVKATALDKAKEDLAEQRRRRQCSLQSWEIMAWPPTFEEVQQWLDGEQEAAEDYLDDLEVDAPPTASQIKRKNRPAPELSQIEGPTQKNKHGFKYSQHKATTSVQHETGYMSTMSLEVHVNSRGDLAPNPERDEINMVVWCLSDDQMNEETKMGIVLLSKEEDMPDRVRCALGNNVQLDTEDDELNLLNTIVDIVRALDPDILTGFEVHNNSWGYLIERARLQYEFNLPDELSRMKSQSHGRFGKDADRWGFTHTSTIRITGRHTINIWRAMRS